METNKLDPEDHIFYHLQKNKISKEHENYIKNHPEIKQLLNDYISSLLMQKPEDIFEFSKDYFSYFKKKGEENNNINYIKPLVVVGPSGSGKGTLIKHFLKNFDCFKLSISYTTRKKREGEIDGKEYYFINEEEFLENIVENKFIEHVKYNENRYGTGINEIDKANKEKKILILEIEMQGAIKIFKSKIDCNFIFIFPPSIEELRNRLIKRGTESIETIDKRINIAKREIEEVKDLNFFKYKEINDNLESFIKKMEINLKELYSKYIE